MLEEVKAAEIQSVFPKASLKIFEEITLKKFGLPEKLGQTELNLI